MKDSETARFFDGRESAWPLYEALEKRLVDLFPAVRRKVQKTQISFSNRRMCVCASFARVKRKAELPDPYLVVTLGLSYPLDSERIAAKTEPYPGRWTTHIVIGSIDEIDEELLTWLSEAYAFAEAK